MIFHYKQTLDLLCMETSSIYLDISQNIFEYKCKIFKKLEIVYHTFSFFPSFLPSFFLFSLSLSFFLYFWFENGQISKKFDKSQRKTV